MKKKFLLDENAFICAWTGKDEQGQEYLSPSQLVLNIAANCHRLVLFPQLQIKYWNHAKSMQSQTQRPPVLNVVNVIDMLVRKENKVHYLPAVEQIELPDDTPSKDAENVRATIQCQAILVTTDGRLARKLEETGVMSKYQLKVLRPEAALPFSGPDS